VADTLLSHGAGSFRSAPPPDPLAAAAELASAVAELHREGLVHGRIHAGNVLRVGGRVSLREVAAPAAPLPADTADLDALACAAPEVLRGRPARRAADVHALALVVADLLAGRVPGTPASFADVVHAGLHRAPIALVASVPPAVPRLLRRATSRHPWRRPSAAALARALAEASRGPAPALPFAGPPRAAPSPWPSPPVGERDHVLLTSRFVSLAPRPGPLPRWGRGIMVLLTSRFVSLAPRQRGEGRGEGQRAPAPPRLLPALTGALSVVRSHRRLVVAALAIVLATGAVALVRRAGSLEREVARRLAARDVDGARRLLREAERARAKGPTVDKLRGDVACAARGFAECLSRYEAALAGDPSLGREPSVRQNALALAARGDDRRALVAVLARLPGIDGELLAMTTSPRYWPRWNAVRALEARGAGDRVDRARVYALDLLHAGSCDTRRAAAQKLAALRDPRVLPELTQAREAARSSWSEWRCTGREVEDALRAARQARVAAR